MINDNVETMTETMNLVPRNDQDTANTVIPDEQRDGQPDLPAQGMKVNVPVKAFKEALLRASLAAMTYDGQTGFRAGNEIRGCVRISAKNGEIVFDAGVSLFSSRHIVKVGAGSNAVIEAEGEACVPAKELHLATARIPSKCHVVLTFISQSPEQYASTSEKIRSLLPNGVLSVGVIRRNRLVASCCIDS